MENTVVLNRMFKGISLDRSAPRFRSLGEEAYEHILTKVVFPDGEDDSGIEYAGKITEKTIAKALDMSNGPIRDAIIRLRHEGFIQTLSNRGSFLIDFSDPEIAVEIYRFRQSFEVGVFYMLAASITQGQVDELRRILATMEKAREQTDITSYRKADLKFHLQATEYSIGPAYAQLLRPKLMQWFAMAFHVLTEAMGTERYRHNLEVTDVSSHQDLFESLVARDSERAARLISGHCGYVVHLLGLDNDTEQNIA